MKRNNIRSYVGAEDCKVTGNDLSNDVDMKDFGIHEEPFDNAASQASYCDMDQWSSYPPEQLEFHLDNLASIDQLDDVFLVRCRCRWGRDHFLFWGFGFMGRCQKGMAPQAEVALELEHDKGDSRLSDEEISMEESILQHLENLTSQLTAQTRICFRDSLYRLADNSKHDAFQSRNAMPDQDSTRFREEETAESQTNIIDRTVANLLFSNVECGASEGSSLDFTEATNIRQHSGCMLWNVSGSSGCDAPTFSG
ncbi:hypothetical protein HAX54_001479 [Datura stramonium]|uniref:Uncharacterized protein n=1 Tax=Datura stramonium TaxID=4076 RepID=A0ABS8T4I4_DATST|nr:hypothetical protein [Datura stramonium]